MMTATLSRLQMILLIGFSCIAGLSLVSSPYPSDQFLQHIATLIAMIILWIAAKRGTFCNLSFVSILIYLLLHVIGARYVYSNVPYDAWSEAVIGRSISDIFGFERNHYDRLVHFSFGLLLMVPMLEFSVRVITPRVRWGYFVAICIVAMLSMLYEVFEWSLAFMVAPERAEAYLGQQGDIWDAQKDMALATLGSLITAVVLWVSRFPDASRLKWSD